VSHGCTEPHGANGHPVSGMTGWPFPPPGISRAGTRQGGDNKIAEVFASRRLALLSEIEAAVGREIVQVKARKESRRKVTVALKPDDGTDLHLETRAAPEIAAPERLRRAEK